MYQTSKVCNNSQTRARDYYPVFTLYNPTKELYDTIQNENTTVNIKS